MEDTHRLVLKAVGSKLEVFIDRSISRSFVSFRPMVDIEFSPPTYRIHHLKNIR